MHQSFSFSSLFLLLLMYSCNSAPTQSNDNIQKDNQYYDLKSFFEQEINRLRESPPRLIKSVTLNGKEEKQESETVDFENEFSIFSESHINKVSWWGKYSGDTTYYDNGKISRIAYTASDESLKTKTIKISFSRSGHIDSLFILNVISNPTVSTRQTLSYTPNKHYEIISQEKVMMSKDREIRIEGIFSE